ncbi:MAG: hypothetical protein U1A27_03445 [Phycisphaerae bacterium]
MALVNPMPVSGTRDESMLRRARRKLAGRIALAANVTLLLVLAVWMGSSYCELHMDCGKTRIWITRGCLLFAAPFPRNEPTLLQRLKLRSDAIDTFGLTFPSVFHSYYGFEVLTVPIWILAGLSALGVLLTRAVRSLLTEARPGGWNFRRDALGLAFLVSIPVFVVSERCDEYFYVPLQKPATGAYLRMWVGHGTIGMYRSLDRNGSSAWPPPSLDTQLYRLPRVYLGQAASTRQVQWAVILPTILPVVVIVSQAVMSGVRRKWFRKDDLPRCKCGYCLQGNVSGICPECGASNSLAVAVNSKRKRRSHDGAVRPR